MIERAKVVGSVLIFLAGVSIGIMSTLLLVSSRCYSNELFLSDIEGYAFNPVDPPHDLQNTGYNSTREFETSQFTDTIFKAIPFLSGSPISTVFSYKPSLRSDNLPTFEAATSGCDQLEVVVNGNHKRTCLVMLSSDLPNAAHHVYKYKKQKNEWYHVPRVTPWEAPLTKWYADGQRDIRLLYNSIDEIQDELSPILSGIARNGTIVVMVANEGVLDILFNFVASARTRNLSLSNLIVFGSSPQVVSAIQSIGIESYYHSGFGEFPQESAGLYGDRVFARIMWLKTAPLFVVSQLGYNILFQDTDLIWFRDPHEYLWSIDSDTIWSDDGARSERYNPLFINTGFYYLRHSDRVLALMKDLVHAGDMVLTVRSHQEIVTQILAEHISRYGTSVHLLPEETFPGGHAYLDHYKHNTLGRFTDGAISPIIFHMHWTANRSEKVYRFMNMGWWYLTKECTSVYILDHTDDFDGLERCFKDPSVIN